MRTCARRSAAADLSLAAAVTAPWAPGPIPVLDIGADLAGEAGAAAPPARAKVGKYDTGYLPLGGQVVRHSPVHKSTKPNLSDSFRRPPQRHCCA